MGEDILTVKGLKKHFHTPQGTVRAVNGIDFSIVWGETLGFVGESGSGKSTVAYTLIGVYAPTEGQLLFKGQNVGRDFRRRPMNLKKDMQIVFQDPGSSLNPRRSIKQILELPLKVHRISSNEDRTQRVAELLTMVGLPIDYTYKYPRAIGGGEKQIVAIARALATEPSLVLLDEPTSALDVSMQAKVINLLIELREKLNLTYLFITHDLSLMRNVAMRVAIMYLGKIDEVASASEFFQKPLHPYTQMLFSSIPVSSEEEEALKPKKIISKGEIPSPVNIPSGCAFHPRCPERMEICSRVDPEMVEVEEDHFVRCHLYSNR